MNVTVRLFAVLRERAGQSAMQIPSQPGATVATVWEQVVAAQPALDEMRAAVQCAVNGAYATSETPVHDGDEVAFLPPMSGGSGGALDS